jgi:predicted Rossmann-fold nucleotide-binding protein
MLDWIREGPVKRGFIAESELELITLVDDPDELVAQIVWCEEEKCYLNPDGLMAHPSRRQPKPEAEL